MTAQIKTMSMDRSNIETTDSSWKSLYRVGGTAALIAAVLFVIDVVVLITGGSAPGSASEWFTLLQSNRAAGLLQLFFTDVIGIVLTVPIVIALYAALRRLNDAYVALAAVLALIGITLVLATNFNYSLIHLSDQYAAATTAAEQSQLLTAAESALAAGSIWATGPLMASFFLEGGLATISVLMLRSMVFGKGIAYLGIAAHGLDFARAAVFLILIPLVNGETALAVGVPLLWIGGTLQLLWYPLVGWRLLRLGR